MTAINDKFKTGIKPLACALTLLSLVNCGSGSGGDITLTGNDGQTADPVVVEVPIAYVKRVVPTEDSDLPDFSLREPLAYHPGAQLYVRPRAASTALETNITTQMLARAAAELSVDVSELTIDIKGLNTAFDGTTLIFAARIVPEPIDDNLEDTTWNLWQYDFETGEANYVIESIIIRNEAADSGSSQDIAPHYLPDGRIVFSSTRQVNTLPRLAAEGKPVFINAGDGFNTRGPTTVLHILDPVTNSFEQISFNTRHDINPSVIGTGEIVFSRWDNGPDRLSLYKINPSGRQLSRLYGYHSNDSGTDPTVDVEFSQPREMQDGRLMTILRPSTSTTLGGNIVIIDAEGFVDHDQPVWSSRNDSGSGQSNLTTTNILIDDPLSPGGQYSAAFPLHDGTDRVLVSWSQCRAMDDDLAVPCTIAPAGAEAAPLFYGLWIYSPNDDTQLPIINPQEGFIYTEIVAAESRTFPAVPIDTGADVFDASLISGSTPGEGHGLLKIDSVYDFDGVDNSGLDAVDNIDVGIAALSNPADPAYATRAARFIRIVKPVLFPDGDDDNFEIPAEAFGGGNRSMREILGYAPIEPDGSVAVKVPANTPFTFSIIDERGRRLNGQQRHEVWMQLGPGEIMHCSGCHEAGSDVPHGRLDSQPPSSNPGASSIAVDSGTGIGFPNTKINRNDYPVEFLDGADLGQTMADIFDLQRPLPSANKDLRVRDLSLDRFTYDDDWADTVNGQTADPSLDYSYGTDWTDTPLEASGQAAYVNRLVINYVDHIQQIWERSARVMIDPITGVQVLDPDNADADSCVSCHSSSTDGTPDLKRVPASQLDLTAYVDLDNNNTYYRSFRELMNGSNELWDTNPDPAVVVIGERVRICDVDDGMGGTIPQEVRFNVPASLQRGSARNSGSFFGCFEGGTPCGTFVQAGGPPANCTEDGTIVTDPLPYNHAGWLSEGELRLLSEWLDIGGQYYNNPFHTDLSP
jgi:Hydrazine synthase alpha subunit middle domain